MDRIKEISKKGSGNDGFFSPITLQNRKYSDMGTVAPNSGISHAGVGTDEKTEERTEGYMQSFRRMSQQLWGYYRNSYPEE